MTSEEPTTVLVTPRPWTTAEIAHLRIARAQGTSLDRIAIDLRRSYESVKSKARELGVKMTAQSPAKIESKPESKPSRPKTIDKPTDEPKPRVNDWDVEIDAMQSIAGLVNGLDQKVCDRVLQWAHDRFVGKM